MPKPISPHPQYERLLNVLSAEISNQGRKINWVARRVNLTEQYLGAVLRREKVTSINTLAIVGKVIGLELHMEWRKK